MHVRQYPRLSLIDQMERANSVRIVDPSLLQTSGSSDDLGVNIVAGSWDSAKSIIHIKRGSFAILDFGFNKVGKSKFQLIMIGFDLDWNPLCYVQTGRGKLGARHPPNTLLTSWSEMVPGIAKEIKAGSCSDAWNIRGDCITGFDVKLESLLESRRGSSPRWAFVQMWKEMFEDKLMWNARFGYL